MTVIVIPARAGSKGICAKNLRKLRGVPLIEWAITAALLTPPCGIDIVVTTDDPAVLKVGASLGCCTVERPSLLALDDTPDLPVFEHIVELLKLPDDAVLVHLRPTSPFVRPEDIRGVAAQCEATGWSVRSVIRPRHHPRKMYGEGPNPGRPETPYPFTLTPYTGDRHAANAPRQSLEPVWAAAGYVDAVMVRTVRYAHSMESAIIAPFPVPEPWRAVDLDDEDGWVEAEAIACAQGWRPGEVG